MPEVAYRFLSEFDKVFFKRIGMEFLWLDMFIFFLLRLF